METVDENKLYMVRSSDEVWYRSTLVEIEPGFVVAFFVDIGEKTLLLIEMLLRLFRRRVRPQNSCRCRYCREGKDPPPTSRRAAELPPPPITLTQRQQLARRVEVAFCDLSEC